MRPEEYVAIVLRHWWLVLLAGLITATVAFLFSRSQPPVYQASVRLMAIAQPPDYWLDLYAKNRLASYQDLIRNGTFIAQALAQAGLQDDAGRVIGALQLARNQDSNVVQLVVEDTDPARAARVANALADAFVAQIESENQRILEQFRDPFGQRIQGTVSLIKLDSPAPPTVPIGPRTRLNTAAGLILGLLLGIVLSFVVEYFEDVLRGAHDIQRVLDLPLLAELRAGRSRPRREEQEMMQLVVQNDPLSPAAEAYRNLRTTVLAKCNSERPIQNLLICGVGRSPHDAAQVATNLAAAFAIAGDQVVLIDADLRHPLLHNLVHGTVTSGLAEWLVTRDPVDAPPILATPIAGLQILPAGTLPANTNPVDLFSRPHANDWLSTLRNQADRLIIHTAPLPHYGEALALAPTVDAVLLVVRSGVTPRTAALRAKDQLKQVGARVLGVVFLTGS